VARQRILFTRTTRSRLIIAVRKVTRRAQVARHNFLSTEETSREFRGSQKGPVAAHRGTTRHVEAARRKEFAIGRDHTCDKIGRGTRRLRALRKGLWTRRVGGTGSKDSSGGSYTTSRNIKKWTLWRGRPPPKRKKGSGARRVGYGEPRLLQELAPHLCESAARKRANVKHNCQGRRESGLTNTLSGSRSGRAGLRTGRM
jgi:hypothetical protein